MKMPRFLLLFGAVALGFISSLNAYDLTKVDDHTVLEIEELATGLGNDPVRIFNYVHDNIRQEFYGRAKKGAALTLLEKSGGDVDQCSLLVALLKAANPSATVEYFRGLMEMPLNDSSHRDITHWLKMDLAEKPWAEVTNYLASFSSFRGLDPMVPKSGSTNIYRVPRSWIKYVSGGVTNVMDPGFKVSEPLADVSFNLASAMSLNVGALLSAAGGTTDTNSVAGLNETALRDELRDRSTALTASLHSGTHAGKSVAQISGGWRIVPSVATSVSEIESIEAAAAPLSVNAQWTTWDGGKLYSMEIRLINASASWTFYSAELQGKPLTLTCDGSGVARLLLGGATIFTTSSSGNDEVEMLLSFDGSSRTTVYQRKNAEYAIFYTFDPSGDILKARELELETARETYADSSPEVVRATLQVMAIKWRLQTAMAERLLAHHARVLPLTVHHFGRMAQESAKGYYIDAYHTQSAPVPNDGWTTTALTRRDGFFDVSSYFLSAMEHGLIEQLQSSGLVAASTVKMLSLASAERVYLAHSNNWTFVSSAVTGYNAADLATWHANYISSNYSILMPTNGAKLVAGSPSTWKGYGIAAVGGVAPTRTAVMLISGGYNGGYVSQSSATLNTPFIIQASKSGQNWFDTKSLVTEGDPVNMADGSFRMEATDLAFGDTEPRGVTFSRFYSSRRQKQNAAQMANGWLHNYYLKITETSVPEAGLGTTTPGQMAPMLAATCAAWNLYSTTPDAKNWTVTALIAKWGVDQLINRAVSIDMGNDTLLFVQQPNGAYEPPAGNTMTLAKVNGNYELQERNGRLFKFNADKQLETITDPYGKTLTVGYDGSKRPTTVTDFTNRVLTLTYTNTPVSRLIAVTDANASPTRSVTFQYATTHSAQGDLTAVTDSEGKTCNYEYDANHRMTKHTDAKAQVVTQNIYDALGRVSEQNSEGDTDKKWRFFWTGVDNRSQNPAGNVERFYYDDKTRLIGRRDGSGIVTTTEYDGEDHVVRTVTPVSTNAFKYNAANNLEWSEDGLAKKTYFYYDSSNRLYRVVDPRGYTNTTLYNTKHQVVRQENPMGNWVEFLYDADHGTLSKQTNAALGVTTFTYDSYGQLANVIHPSGLGTNTTTRNARGDVTTTFDGQRIQTDLTWNKRRQLTDVAGPLSQSAHTQYDDNGDVWKTQDGRSYWTERTWTATRKLKTTTLPTVTAGTAVLENSYDDRDWLEIVKDPLLNSTRYEYRANGAVASVTEPIRKLSTGEEVRYTVFTYDAGGRRVRSWNFFPNETNRWQLNARGETEVSWNPLDYTVGRVYDDGGNMVKLTNRLNRVWTFQYDAANRMTNVNSPEGRAAKQQFDERGLLRWRQEPSGDANTMVYDQRSRLATNSDSMGTKVYAYDFNSNLKSVTEGGQTVSWNYDAYDRPSLYTDGLGAQVGYAYDANGNLTNLTYAARNVSYTYDARNQLTEVRDWKGRKTLFEYDLNGRLKKVTRPNGTVREIGYNDGGQTTNIVERTAGGAGIAFGRLNWDVAQRADWEWLGPKPHAWTPPTRTSVVVDKDNLITNYYNGQTTISVVHDLDGNMTSGPDARGVVRSHTFNARNQLTGTSGSVDIYGAAYATTNAPSTLVDIGASGQAYGYGPVNLKVAGGGAVVSRVVPSAYVRNNFSGWVGFKFTTGPSAMKVSELGRWVLPGNSRDHVVKLVDSTGANVSGGQTTVVTAGAAPHQFAYGTLSSPITLAASSTYYLVSEELNTGDTWYDYGTRNLGPGSWTYTYDAAGHRLRADNGAVGYRYVWNPAADLPQVLIRANPDSTTTYYIHGTGGIGLLYEITESAGGIELGTRTYHYDYRGSTVALTDGGANVTDRIEYSAYGQISYRTGRTDTPFLFNGRFGVQTDGNGLLYMHARYYNPYLCRFMNADPSGFEGGLNFYAFADGNPISLIDPFGLGAMGTEGVGGWLGQAAGGFFVDGAWGSVKGMYGMVTDIPGTISGLYNAAVNYEQTFSALKSGLQDFGGRLAAGDPRAFGRAAFEVAGAVAGAGTARALRAVKTVANPVPSTMARVIPEGIPATTLGRPGAADVFVTAADDIAGMNASQIANRLGIPQSPTGFRVFEFPTPQSGVASPVFRTDPGFIGGGLTSGGAREFVIPNGPIPPGAIIRTVP